MGTHRAGRRSKTREELERAGTFRKDRHSDLTNPEPSSGTPEPPAELGELERSEWDRMIWAFQDMGMLHKVDAFAVYQYCRLYAETERVAEQQRECEASVEVLETNIKDIEHSELVQLFGQIVILRKLISKCTDQLRTGRMAIRQYLVEFGLTPASRGRIKLPLKREEADEFTKYQRGRVA